MIRHLGTESFHNSLANAARCSSCWVNRFFALSTNCSHWANCTPTNGELQNCALRHNQRLLQRLDLGRIRFPTLHQHGELRGHGHASSRLRETSLDSCVHGPLAASTTRVEHVEAGALRLARLTTCAPPSATAQTLVGGHVSTESNRWGPQPASILSEACSVPTNGGVNNLPHCAVATGGLNKMAT